MGAPLWCFNCYFIRVLIFTSILYTIHWQNSQFQNLTVHDQTHCELSPYTPDNMKGFKKLCQNFGTCFKFHRSCFEGQSHGRIFLFIMDSLGNSERIRINAWELLDAGVVHTANIWILIQTPYSRMAGSIDPPIMPTVGQPTWSIFWCAHAALSM